MAGGNLVCRVKQYIVLILWHMIRACNGCYGYVASYQSCVQCRTVSVLCGKQVIKLSPHRRAQGCVPHGAYSKVSTASSRAENGQRLEVAKTGAVSAAGERESGLMMMFFPSPEPC